MARQERRNMADSRAMEEQMSRMMLHGAGVSSAYGGRMTGAGATPSMGLSQFRGGRRSRRRSPSPPSESEYDEEEMDDEDMDLEGGFLGAFSAAMRAAAARAAAAAARAAARTRAAAENARRAALGRTTQVKPSTGTAPRPPAKAPAAPAPPKAPAAPPKAPSAPRTGDKVIGGPKGPKAPSGSTKAKIATGMSRLGTIANVAVPAYMLADYLRQQGATEDLGYFDDYAGEGTPDELDEGAVVDEGGVADDSGDTGPPPDEDPYGPFGTGTRPATDKDALAASLGLTRKQYDIFVRSGNLPVRGRGVVGGRTPRRPPPPPVFRDTMPRMYQPPPVSRIPQLPVRRPRATAPMPMPMPRMAVRAPDIMPMLTASGRKSKATGRRQARAEVVKKVMRERGVKLGEASRIVKEEGLF